MADSLPSQQQIYDFLKKYQLIAVATYGDFPWIANVYYAVNPDLKLFFLSNPSRIHCQQISTNPLVACSIYDSTQTPVQQKDFVKIGIQISGTARLLENDAEIDEAIELWKKALNLVSDDYSLMGIKTHKISGQMYEITPQKVKMFNDALFDEEHVPLLEI